MKITENNVKTAAAIMEIIAKNKCTVTDAKDILYFCSREICSSATVPEQDYLEEYTKKLLPKEWGIEL